MSLKDHLKAQEERVDTLLKSATRYLGALKAWKKACTEGHIANLQKAAQSAQELSVKLPEATEETRSAWSFDIKEYLASGEWQSELKTLVSEEHGLGVVVDNEILISSPIVVRSLPERGILMLGKAAFPTIHPNMVGKELKRLRDRAASANSQEFLEALYQAFIYLNRGNSTPIPVKFVDVYNLWCITPGYKKETSPSAFGQLLYALHRSELSATRAGKKMTMEFASGNYKEREVFSVMAEDGRPIRYFTVVFG
jgi:hypothetical protein